MALDVATKCGWALYDTDRPPSAIQSGSLHFEGATAFAKVADMRRKLPKLIRQLAPDFCAIEAPLARVIEFKKVSTTLLGEEEETSTINPGTVMQLNRLAGAAQMVVEGQNVLCEEVAPRTWQSILPRGAAGNSKKRAKDYCDSLKIVSPNMDSRDACVIAIWAAGRAQKLRMMERARA